MSVRFIWKVTDSLRPNSGTMRMRSESSYNFLRERNIIVLISCRIIWGLTQALFMPYFSLFVLAQEGVTPELLGIIVSVRAVGTAVMSPLAGYLADSLGRKRIIFAGTALHAVSYLLYVIATDFRMIFIGSLIEGLAVVHMPALQAITQDSLVKSRRGLGLSATTGLQALPSLISPFIGGLLADQMGIDMGMRIGFSLAFVVGIGVAFIRLKFLRETVDRTTEKVELKSLGPLTKKSYSGMFSLFEEYKALRGIVLLAVLDTFFASITAPFWIVYAGDVVGISTVEWGLIEIIVAGVNVVALFFSGNFVDRFGRKKIMLLNLLLAPVMNLSFIYCQNFPQMLLFRISLTIQNAFMMPAAAALMADIVPRKDRGRAIAAIGWQPIVITLGAVSAGFFRFPPFFVGSVLSGYVYELDPRYPWFLLAGGFFLELIVCHFFIKETEKPAD